jgi:hypothetical protein
MQLESLIESEIDRFRRKDLEIAGWITVDVDRNSRKLVTRPSFLGQIFSTVAYAVNPRGLARHVVRGCTFSEPLGRRKLACDVELTLSFPEQSEHAFDRARAIIGDLARVNLDPIAAIDMLVHSSAAKVQGQLTEETIFDFDAIVLPRFHGDLAKALWTAGLKADVSIEWEGYVETEPYNMDDIVVPFRIPGVARRLETKLSCEIVPDARFKAVIACLRPDKARVTRVAKEAIAAYFDDPALFDKLLADHRAVQAACGQAIDESLKPYAHRLRGFALLKPQGLPATPVDQVQVEVETLVQLSDSERKVPVRHTAQLVLADYPTFVVKSLDRVIDPKDHAIKVIQAAAAKLLQGKTFVDLVQAFVLDPLNAQRRHAEPKLPLGRNFSLEITNGLKEIGYDIHHIATAPKAKLVDILIQSPNITLTQDVFQLRGGAKVTVGISFNGSVTSLDEIRGRMTLDTDPVADMQSDLPGVVQAVLGNVSPFEYDMGTPLETTGLNWLEKLRTDLTNRLSQTFGFTVHNLQINALESDPRVYLRKLQAGGGHSFIIDNKSPSEDGNSGGLMLRLTYGVKEPVPLDETAEGLQVAYRTYQRYIDAGLHIFELEAVHKHIQSAIKGQLNPLLGRMTREQIQAMLAVGRSGADATMRGYYNKLVERAEAFIADTFGLMLELNILVEDDDPLGFATIAAQSDVEEFKNRKGIERAVRIAKAETARMAWDNYHRLLLSYDPATADAADKQALEDHKKKAQELEKESTMGSGSHVGRWLQNGSGQRETRDLSKLFGPSSDPIQPPPKSSERDDTIDVQ